MMQRFKTMIPGFLFLGISACHTTDTYHSFQSIPKGGWTRQDTLCFALPTPPFDSLPCQPYLELRHTGHYPYRSLWVVVAHNTADSTRFVADTIECSLTDPQGHFTGAGLNNLYQQSYPLPTTVVLHKHPSNKFKISHCMQDDTLHGIHDIGIRLSYDRHLSAGK